MLLELGCSFEFGLCALSLVCFITSANTEVWSVAFAVEGLPALLPA